LDGMLCHNGTTRSQSMTLKFSNTPISYRNESVRVLNTVTITMPRYLGLDTHLFVKVSRPGDSEVTFTVFESSYWISYYDYFKTANCSSPYTQ